MMFSAAMFGAMAFSAKMASARLSGPQVAMVRFAFGLLPVLLVPQYRRAAMKFQRLDLIVLRGFFGGIAVLLYFLAIAHINAGVATLLNYTAPIWSGLFSMLFIGEKLSPKVLIPLPIAFLGILMVVQSHASSHPALAFGPWALAGACSAIASGAAVTAMRAARRTENSWSVYGSFCLLGLIVTAPLGILTWKTPTPIDWLWLFATAFFAIFAQLNLTFSLRWVDAVTVGVISQLAVVIALTLGAIFLGDTITPQAAFGALVTISGVVGVTYVTSLSKPKTAADEVVPES
jgi:drug/metabolite transporter (DMT)-like permease